MAKVDVKETSEDKVVANEAASNNVKEENQEAKSGVNQRTILEAVIVVLLIAVAVWAGVLYSQKQDLQDKLDASQSKLSAINNDPQIAVQQQTKSLLNNVGQLINLPQGETPTIATVSDAAKAKKQSDFFKNAENGDKVLMYVKAGQAILYRPSTNKIIIVAPLTFSKGGSSNTAQ